MLINQEVWYFAQVRWCTHQILQRPNKRCAQAALVQLFSITQIYDLMDQLQDAENIHASLI